MLMMPIHLGGSIMQSPFSKWFQTIFWPISCLPSFGHIPKHSADDYVGRTSPLLATAFAFWICAIVVVVLLLITNGIALGDLNWRGAPTILGVLELFLLVIYASGFYMFANREDDYPN